MTDKYTIQGKEYPSNEVIHVENGGLITYVELAHLEIDPNRAYFFDSIKGIVTFAEDQRKGGDEIEIVREAPRHSDSIYLKVVKILRETEHEATARRLAAESKLSVSQKKAEYARRRYPGLSILKASGLHDGRDWK